MVSSLIDEDTKWWKSDLVRSIFLPFKAESILKIPISYSLPEDQLIWMGNKRGSFTVKSAMCVVEENETGKSTAEHNQSPFWRRIWHLKVRIFAWRACRNGLPTKLNLRCRGLNSSSFCPLCNKEMESLQHALLHCTHAKHTWVSWLDCPVNLSTTSADIVDLASQFIGLGKLSELDLFFMVLWSIWGNRNQAIHNDSAIPPIQVWESARGALLDYNDSRLIPLPSPPPARVHWTAPPPGFLRSTWTAQQTTGEATPALESSFGTPRVHLLVLLVWYSPLASQLKLQKPTHCNRGFFLPWKCRLTRPFLSPMHFPSFSP